MTDIGVIHFPLASTNRKRCQTFVPQQLSTDDGPMGFVATSRHGACRHFGGCRRKAPPEAAAFAKRVGLLEYVSKFNLASLPRSALKAAR